MRNKNDVWITSLKGNRIHTLDPRSEDLDIEEIAVGLSRECRFSRMIKRGIWYSSAEHGWHVSYLCHKKYALAGLLHDSSDYVFGDLNAPTKHSKELKGFDRAEKRFQSCIFQKYCGFPDEPLNVKVADLALAMWEAEKLLAVPPEHLLSPKPLGIKLYCWNPKMAEKKFLERFRELTKPS